MEQTLTQASGLAPKVMRRLVVPSAQTQASRYFGMFTYPHSFRGSNNAYNHIPVIEKE